MEVATAGWLVCMALAVMRVFLSKDDPAPYIAAAIIIAVISQPNV